MLTRFLAFAAACLISLQATARELPDFTDLVEKQGPAVVNISTTRIMRNNLRPGVSRNDPFSVVSGNLIE